jgi:hypothetical protein
LQNKTGRDRSLHGGRQVLKMKAELQFKNVCSFA